MRTKTLMTIQFTSLALIIICADKLLAEFLPTLIFFLSFTTFAMCSIYISKHEKELIRENNRRAEKSNSNIY